MNAKRKWLIFGAVSLLVAAGAGTLIYFQQQKLDENRDEAERLRGEIAAGRELVSGTPDLEREVIVQRETDTVIKEILSEEEEITNFARTINDYAAEAGVVIRSVKRQKNASSHKKGKGPKDFDRVGYSIQFDADAFQLLALLDAFESHQRFVSVTSFKLTAAKRTSAERGEVPLHGVTLDLETYVYHPKQGSDEVRIDNYERKRDLLLADIQKRSNDMRVRVYDYRGPRGRRDPWIDPRLPRTVNPTTPIEAQIAAIEELETELNRCWDLWGDVEDSKIIIEEMKARAALDEALLALSQEVERVQPGIIFGPSQTRLDNVIIAGIEEIKGLMEDEGFTFGVSAKEIAQVRSTVQSHIEHEEYELALQAFTAMEPRLLAVKGDEELESAVAELRAIADRVEAVLDFETISMDIGGIAVMEGLRPVALINGETVAAGEYVGLSGDLFVNDIRPHEIEFVYRGVTLLRRIDDRTAYSPSASTRSLKRN